MNERKGHILGIVFLLLCIVAFLPGQYGRWRADWKARQDWGRTAEQRREDAQAALAAIGQTSPDPLARLREHGVELTYDASRQGNTLKVEYTLASQDPVEKVIPLGGFPAPSPRLYDRVGGKDLGRHTGGGAGWQPGKATGGHMNFDLVIQAPAQAEVQMDPLSVYLKPPQPIRWEIRRAGAESQIQIGQRFTAAGVEFEVEQVRFAGRKVHIEYRQITAPARTGFWLLSFRLRDGLGGNWENDLREAELPNPSRLTQSFDFIPWLSSTMTVEVAHAVLLVPGPAVPVEVK